ncbi:MAG: 23S rRNA (guanosine(2251)-2'-O)-methyltransferase RlmB [Rickettsiaceae bacterium]|nr:23S rRNA (guanosine(2251)-2'-O)-methyltransferase RlmB [Rickettsiaceae bacterium]MDP4832281.1 23S rRNA (guanosine(2251)-2'-O)-methyltransferase RlmB [Rickettsiaceae bacterium]MDP5020264.1 23S rRNA (guanosine(2251)-2'-O)-methyltransferase RlmB [Rickettsiaceae bacterium]MDP5083119.1 23S rRNA (guanosine(2251)-2'-O)-methyltransferase RlmB [Rickettsiaceae bacterium]
MKNHKKENFISKSQYYMYGQHAVLAAARNNNRTIKQIYCLQRQLPELQEKLPHSNIEVVQNDFITKKIGRDQAHQGVIALVDSIFKNRIEDLDFTDGKDRIVILDQVTDPQNIGAIIRSAAAFGINKLILPSDNAPDENAGIAKAACGCLELMQIAKVTNIKNTIERLKKMDFWIAGLDASGQGNINDISEIDKLAIIIGSEGKGMRRLTSTHCDFLIKIPISEHVESLNASNAASIIFYLLKV